MRRRASSPRPACAACPPPAAAGAAVCVWTTSSWGAGVGVGETGSGHREAVVAAECSLCKIGILRRVGIALPSAVAVEGVRRRSTDEERLAAPLS